jgi:hypothetical protein
MTYPRDLARMMATAWDDNQSMESPPISREARGGHVRTYVVAIPAAPGLSRSAACIAAPALHLPRHLLDLLLPRGA